ncbi:MAG: trehalose-phosphatase [Deltaproteobacteria bacterium]|nr:trehalose-phosphatase [Deltaproteobacteria bacterium]
MHQILGEANRSILEQFAWSEVLLAFDFDGTLAPIVSEPGAARMRSATRTLLEEVATRYPCVVISGRAREDARRRLAGIAVCDVSGNHGLEPGRDTARLEREVRRWRRLVEPRLAGHQGVLVEDKRFSIAIHYRLCRRKKEALAAIQLAVASLGEVRLIGGKQVVNVQPPGAPHKGIALESLRSRFGCDTAIYVGDDETDEDVFGLDDPGRLLGIRVGARRASAARYYLRNQREVDTLLRVLLSLRRRREDKRLAWP